MIDHLVVQKPKAFGAAATSLKTRERVKGCRVFGWLFDGQEGEHDFMWLHMLKSYPETNGNSRWRHSTEQNTGYATSTRFQVDFEV